ncbi:hypothetical protein V6183_17320 [Enterobacter hormaechei]|uniref:Morphogenetic protein n=1 Tax=Salmonella enterica TaxID=28901 RepID=A0A3F3IRC9_SALER|nr:MULTISPECIES: hypothetical protein [Enterobacteriaceae]EBP3401795.1 hypothetical protein [Salmonella enterica subsp. enterica]EED2673939.1 hypothetical protein [Salmonella enterica subsp. enterica serovar Weslaco]EBB9389300.1 hypothetical protein [Salmonella enterica]EHA8175257.1 hypothetical protein [Salmonella enterica subsp. enterica]EIK4443105.1 hypothetical protein [Salmonella enterica]
MTERGMIFNGEMVRAIRDGQKTQTRRIMKVQPDTSEFGLRRIIESSIANEIGMYFWSQEDARGIKARSKQFSCPYGDVGDRIWVRETWWQAGQSHARYPDDDEYGWYGSRRILFAADGNPPNEPNDHYPNGLGGGKFSAAKPNHLWRKRPSIHMPRWASRILLEITDVRVERLNSISETDAEAEGIDMEALFDSQDCYDCIAGHNMTGRPTATGAFKYLWETIYGSDSWQTNPWVWVIEFKRIEGDGHATD